MPVRDPIEAERMIDAFAAAPNGALLISGVPPPAATSEAIFKEAVRHRLPTMYGAARNVQDGVLMSYGPDVRELLRGAASYIDRILRGAKPSDLPVQFPTKFELTINLKTAKAIGLEVPPTMLARADEVIE